MSDVSAENVAKVSEQVDGDRLIVTLRGKWRVIESRPKWEHSLKGEMPKRVKVEVDQERRRKEVEEVTDSDFFRDLEGRAAEMRRRAKGNG